MAPERVELTPEQRAIVEAGDGPVVVIAGAGTGKTRVIVERVRWLLETKGDATAPAGSCAGRGRRTTTRSRPSSPSRSSS